MDPTQALIQEYGLKLNQLDAFYKLYKYVGARYRYKRVAANLQVFFDKGLTTSPNPHNTAGEREMHFMAFTPKGKALAIKIAKLAMQPVMDAYARIAANRPKEG